MISPTPVFDMLVCSISNLLIKKQLCYKQHITETYLKGVETVFCYETFDQIPGIISDIERMDPVQRQATIDRTVQNIRGSNRWQETARTLVALATKRS